MLSTRGTTKKLTVALLVALWVSPIFAGWEDIESKEFKLAKPPQKGSAEYKKDFEVLHDYQKTRDQAECDAAAKQLKPEFETMYASTGLMTEAQAAEAESLVTRVMKFAERVAEYHKLKFLRNRPYVTDPTIKPCIKAPKGNKSYPSGHATVGAAGSCVLAKLFPKNYSKLMEVGEEIGNIRVVVGVHHPSDVEAGQTLAADICERISEEDDFKDELAEVAARL